MSALFTNQTANGNSAAFDHPGGAVAISFDGEFDNALCLVKVSQDNGTVYRTMLQVNKPMVRVIDLDYPATPYKIRVDLVNAHAATDVSCRIESDVS